MDRSWLQSSYEWEAASLEARPSHTKEQAAAASQQRRAPATCQVRPPLAGGAAGCRPHCQSQRTA